MTIPRRQPATVAAPEDPYFSPRQDGGWAVCFQGMGAQGGTSVRTGVADHPCFKTNRQNRHQTERPGSDLVDANIIPDRQSQISPAEPTRSAIHPIHDTSRQPFTQTAPVDPRLQPGAPVVHSIHLPRHGYTPACAMRLDLALLPEFAPNHRAAPALMGRNSNAPYGARCVPSQISSNESRLLYSAPVDPRLPGLKVRDDSLSILGAPIVHPISLQSSRSEPDHGMYTSSPIRSVRRPTHTRTMIPLFYELLANKNGNTIQWDLRQDITASSCLTFHDATGASLDASAVVQTAVVSSEQTELRIEFEDHALHTACDPILVTRRPGDRRIIFDDVLVALNEWAHAPVRDPYVALQTNPNISRCLRNRRDRCRKERNCRICKKAFSAFEALDQSCSQRTKARTITTHLRKEESGHTPFTPMDLVDRAVFFDSLVWDNTREAMVLRTRTHRMI